ncbi:MAG: YafY family transcriptional regulator [Acetatifactor sp.]|nr:YafY family transcriptional regulator [Acetatifactor sp.]
MKVDRLVGILAMLLQRDTMTAPELAEHFEVSRRTINRDIESLCKAGIPICTRQGVGGGISIMEDYRLERMLLSNKEMREILAGLRGLDSISGSRHYARLMEKLCAGSSAFVNGRDYIWIDLSSWYKGALAPKIENIQTAIENRRLLNFRYYGPKGESERSMEPYYLVFRWSNWYVWGWCTKREDFRLFKLIRMENVELSVQEFTGRMIPEPDFSDERVFSGGIVVKALFSPEVKWRLIESFGPHCFTEQEDGRLLFEEEYTNEEYLLSWLLGFGDKVTVLEPEFVREALRGMAENMLRMYRRNGYAI